MLRRPGATTTSHSGPTFQCRQCGLICYMNGTTTLTSLASRSGRGRTWGRERGRSPAAAVPGGMGGGAALPHLCDPEQPGEPEPWRRQCLPVVSAGRQLHVQVRPEHELTSVSQRLVSQRRTRSMSRPTIVSNTVVPSHARLPAIMHLACSHVLSLGLHACALPPG